MKHRLQEFVRQIFPMGNERLHQPPISAGVAGKLFGRAIDILVQARRGPVIKRMCQWNFRLNPCETGSLERKSREKWRTCRERMDCRANIMQKAWQRQFRRARSPANCRVRFAYKS